jgi:hypothetical protein
VGTYKTCNTEEKRQWALVAVSLGVKWQGYEIDHSSPSSAKVKNGRVIPPLTAWL